MGFSSEKVLFPHEIIRPGQDKLIADLEIALREKKILLAHAPTGLGKTAGALSVALACALENNKRLFFRMLLEKAAIAGFSIMPKRMFYKQKIFNLLRKLYYKIYF